MALEMNAYFVTNLSLGDLLALLEKSGEFTIEGDTAHGLGAVAVSDICSEADQEMVEASAGVVPTAEIQIRIQETEPAGADRLVLKLLARIMSERDMDGAVIFGSGGVAFTRQGREFFVSPDIEGTIGHGDFMLPTVIHTKTF